MWFCLFAVQVKCQIMNGQKHIRYRYGGNIITSDDKRVLVHYNNTLLHYERFGTKHCHNLQHFANLCNRYVEYGLLLLRLGSHYAL